ncbi:MAG: mycothiol synthase [Ilumatobacteraceae bacterium]
MWRTETRRKLDDTEFEAVRLLLAAASDHDGFPPLSDHLVIALEQRGPNFAAVLAFHQAGNQAGELAGYGQLARANESTSIELVVVPDQRTHLGELVRLLLSTAIDTVATDGGGRAYWWVHHPGDHVAAIAREQGLLLDRRLLQMRRSLPIVEPTTVETRAFVVGCDEAEWVRVNNAAFHDHPEQGGWTVETLQQREAESWFEPSGFRLHDRDGALAAFCWTKVHSDASPPLGEIYVIAVDPPFHGLGLGKAMTIAGLESLAAHGVAVGMLHVDAANTAALSLYERLGFSIHHEDHAYVGVVISRTRSEQVQ